MNSEGKKTLRDWVHSKHEELFAGAIPAQKDYTYRLTDSYLEVINGFCSSAIQTTKPNTFESDTLTSRHLGIREQRILEVLAYTSDSQEQQKHINSWKQDLGKLAEQTKRKLSAFLNNLEVIAKNPNAQNNFKDLREKTKSKDATAVKIRSMVLQRRQQIQKGS
jgi:hypothetical protein